MAGRAVCFHRGVDHDPPPDVFEGHQSEPAPNATFDPDVFDHWQGVARYHTPDGGVPYLFVTRKDVETMGNLCVVQMPSRNRIGNVFAVTA